MDESFDLVGETVGRYRIVSPLGRGGMGEVYDAVDPSLGRHVALKRLKPDAVTDPKRVARFVREARAASALNHPHLISIYEIGEHDGMHFIVMEKVEGSTLRQTLATRRLTIERAIELMSQVTEAIAAAHDAGIIHRDLKPENVMVSREGYAKVLDFGLAKLHRDATLSTDSSASTLLNASTESGTVLGTVGYMSPEQAQGRPVDARSDIFSLGCILYEAVAGRRAFLGSDPIDSLHKIVHEAPTPLDELAPGTPPELLRIVRKTLAKSPEERYQTARDLALDLRALLRDLGTANTAMSAPEPRRRILIAWIAIFAVVAVAATVVIWSRRSGHATVSPAAVTFHRVTAKGNLVDVAISPDGRFIAYSQYEKGGESLWLRQIASGEDLQLVPPQPATMSGCTFTPDGNAIVYGLKGSSDPLGSFYQVSTIGGAPRRLASGMDSAPAFSPDGKRMAWTRAEFPTPDESALMVVNSDGTGERTVAVRKYPELFAPISWSRPSWSPDGKLIAAPVKRLRNPDSARLVGVDPDTGRETTLSKAPWVSLSALQWLPDGSGIVAVAARTEAEVHAVTNTGNQIWLIPQPSGNPRRITNDLLYYRSISVSNDGSRLVADVADATVNVARKPLDGNGALQGISSGHFDGVAGTSVMTDSRLVLSSIENGVTTLWVMNADGTQRRPFLRQPYRDEYPVAFSGGIAYVSFTPEGADLCVTGENGEERRVVVSGIDDGPIAVSPDGRSFVYAIDRKLFQAFADGRPAKQLTAGTAFGASYSPTGDRIAFLAPGSTRADAMRVVVTDTEGNEVWSSMSHQGACHQTRWTADGSAVLVSTWNDIWVYPLRGEPRILDTFDNLIWSFDVSPDRVLFVARGIVYTRDAVLITGFH